MNKTQQQTKMTYVRYHGKLTGIYNEPMTWKDFFQTAIFIGVLFALTVATIFTIITKLK